MPTSEKQIAANRRNAQRSTGRRTPAGKRSSSRNALKHGILARESLIVDGSQSEHPSEYASLLADLITDRRPEGALENLLVQQIASCYWRLRRILRADALEFGRTLEQLAKPAPILDYHGEKITIHRGSMPPSTSIENILRYENSLQSQLSRSVAHLDRLQQLRLNKNSCSSAAE